ncbi:MAG: tRNA adenosine(34) deaminase TadA [Steroidobacteraceae bacterium]
MATYSDRDLMRQAIELAERASAAGEVPVGALVTQRDKVVGVGWNQPIGRHDPTAHAEVMALRSAAANLDSYRLNGCTLYVTLEPCTMCAAAMVHARLERVVFGAWDQQFGAAGSALNILNSPVMNHRVDAFGGVLAEECSALLAAFFAKRR